MTRTRASTMQSRSTVTAATGTGSATSTTRKKSGVKAAQVTSQYFRPASSSSPPAKRACFGEARLQRPFFDVECSVLARKLLGCTIAHRLPDSGGKVVRGRITETEAYLGGADRAAHSYGGKRTARNAAMYMEPATLYVYVIYGTNHCVNVSSRGDGAAVLLRSIEPLDAENEKAMRQVRTSSSEAAQKMKLKDIGAGPGRLGQALSIKVKLTGIDTAASDAEVWFESAAPRSSASAQHVKDVGVGEDNDNVVVTKRVGVDYAAEWAEELLRFYLLDSRCISVRDKETEKRLLAARVQ